MEIYFQQPIEYNSHTFFSELEVQNLANFPSFKLSRNTRIIKKILVYFTNAEKNKMSFLGKICAIKIK